MNALPDEIAVVDDSLNTVRQLRRMPAMHGYLESDFDRLIATNVSLISSALRNAGVLEEDSELRLIAQTTQVANIDVLLAEVAGAEIQRLVLVETKLFKNPESRRTALAQILEYARTLQYDIGIDAILEATDPATRAWLADRADDLERIKTQGEFLLVIGGDRIQPRLVDIAKPMLDRGENALTRAELALVSLAIYEGEGTRLLVPNVVGAVTGAQRDLCISVTVKTDTGAPVPAKAQVDVAATHHVARAVPSRSKSTWDRETFLADVARVVATEPEEQSWEPALRELLTFVEQMPGLSVRWGTGRGGSFGVVVETESSPVRIAWIDARAWVYMERSNVAAVLGEERATQKLVALAEELGFEVKANGHTPCLGSTESYLDIRDPDALRALFRWLIELRDELIEAQGRSAPSATSTAPKG